MSIFGFYPWVILGVCCGYPWVSQRQGCLFALGQVVIILGAKVVKKNDMCKKMKEFFAFFGKYNKERHFLSANMADAKRGNAERVFTRIVARM